MQNDIIYRANTEEEIHECSYSLLRYLTIYNLKPPSQTRMVIYTSQPALLETYASFFHKFELIDMQPRNILPVELIQQHLQTNSVNVLWMETSTYVLGPLEDLFANLSRGVPYIHSFNAISHHQKKPRQVHIKAGNSWLSTDLTELEKWNDDIIALNPSYLGDLQWITGEALHLEPGVQKKEKVKWLLHYMLQSKNPHTASHLIASFSDLPEFSKLLRTFFNKYEVESVPNQLKLIHHLDASFIRTEKQAYRQLPFHQKLLKRLKGKQWKVENYRV